MRKLLIRVTIVCLIALSSYHMFKNTGRAVQADMAIAKDFTLQNLSGDKLTLSALRGEKVVLMFWATWCPYCRQSLKDFEAKNQEFLDANIKLLAINIGESRARAEGFAKKLGLTFSILLDSDQSVARSYDVVGIPTVILISKDGIIVSDENYLPGNYKELLK